MSKYLKIIVSTLFVLYFSNIYSQVPTIASFSPTSGNVGTSVTITGTNFSTTLANDIVYFGAVKATVTAATATSLTVTVPARSTNDPMTVTVGGLTAASKKAFLVTNSSISGSPVGSRSFKDPVAISSNTSTGTTLGMSATSDVITIADFDGDGKPDIARGSSGSNVRVHLNTTTIGTITTSSFNAGTDFATAGSSWSIISADFDGDGKKDIASGTDSKVSFLRNTTTTAGTITFATKVDLTTSYSSDIRAADFNGDGKIDIAVASNYSSDFTVYLNTSTVGTISFSSTGTTISGASGSRHFTVGDINMDGKPDVIMFGDATYLYINTSSTSTISFNAAVSINSSAYLFYGEVADFDNDGDNDIIGGTTILQNNISGAITGSSFTAFQIASPNYNWNSAGDFNGDGKMDYVQISSNSPGYYNYVQNTNTAGTLTTAGFTSLTKYGAYNSSGGNVKICDVDGDGKQDYISGNMGLSNFSILRNKIGEPIDFYPQYNSSLECTCRWFTDPGTWNDGYDGTVFSTASNNLKLSLSGTTSYTIYGDMTVAAGITMVDAPLDISYYTLTHTGTLTGTSTTAYIKTSGTTFYIHPVSTTATLFGVGNSTYNPVSITNNTGTSDNFSVRVEDAVYQNGASGSLGANAYQKQWIITKTNANTGGTGEAITFNWNSTDTKNGTITTPALYMFNGTAWVKQTATVSGNSITIASYTGALSATKFAIADATTGFAVPTITTTGTLSAFTACSGTNSANQSFTVSGSTLSASISISAPTGFEISTSSSSGFASSLTLTQTGGIVASTTIYVRTTTAATGSPSGNIAFTSTGANAVNVAASGTINTLPTISGTLTTTTIATTQLTGSATANAGTPWTSATTSVATINSTGLVSGVSVGSSVITYKNTNGCLITATVNVTVPAPVITSNGTLSAFTKCAGIISTAQSFTVSGQYLTANIAIAALSGYEYSTDGTTYASTLSLTPTSGTLNSTTVYVRMTAASTGTPSGNIVLSTTGGTSVNVAASGTVYALPTITGTLTTTTIASTQLTGSATANASNPWTSASTLIATVSNTGLVTGVAVGTSMISYTNSNGCQTSATVTVTVPVPVITTTGTLSAFTKCSGLASTAQSFTVSGQYLTANIALAALTGFEYSTDGTTYASTLSLAPSAGTLNTTTIYVRLTAASTGTPSGNIALSTTGATSVNIAATGTIYALPTITGSLAIYNGNTTQLTGSATANASTPWTSANTSVATVNSTGLVTATGVGTSTITYMNTNSCINAAIVTVQATPISISSFSPLSGAPGTSVTITGTNFNTTAANNIVRLNGIKCTVTSATATQLVVTIPARTGYGKFNITNNLTNQVAYSNNKFSIIPTALINPISNTQFSANNLTTSFNTSSSSVPKTHLIADVDDDGKMDFAYYGASGDLTVFRNTSTAGTLNTTSVTSNTKTNGMAWNYAPRVLGADLNGDGKIDFAASNGGYNGGLANINASTTGTVSFNASSDIRSSNANYNVTNGLESFDINGDGKLDIIGFYNTSPAWVYLSQNTSTGGTFSVNTGNTANSYAYSYTTTNLPTVTEFFDVDGDGKQDFIYGTSTGLYVMKNGTALGANLSSFSLTDNTISTGLSNVNGITTADINADGKLDIIITQGSNVSVYINNSTSGTISFAGAVNITLSSTAKGVGAGDLDGDGKIDIIASDGTYTYFIKNTTSGSTATFNTAIQIATQSLTDLNVFDADGDNKLDVIGTNGSTLIAIRNKNGEDPTLTTSSSLNAFNTCIGTASASQSFTVTGINLTANVTVSAPTGYEVSTTSGSGYATSLTLTQNSGLVASTIIYVRLATTASGTPTGNITLSSTGATAQTIAVAGTLNALPAITVQPSTTAQSKCINIAATPLTVTATGTNITYQWYTNSTNSNVGGTIISGANSSTYTPSTNIAGTAYYYVVVSGTCTPNATSNVSGLVTTNALPSVTIGNITNPLATATQFSMPFSSAVSSPNQYSIVVGSQNVMSSFVAVTNATLTTSPIAVTIPPNIANTYDFNLTVKNTTTGCVSNNIPFSVVVAKATPTLTGFTSINKTYGAANFILTNPTSASTGTYSYTISDPNVATISGNNVTITGAGTATITVTQATDNSYNSASTSATLTVAKATNNLTNFAANFKIYGDNSFSLTNPTSPSTGNFSYTSSNTNVATISGNIVTLVGAGTATITASQAADNNYNLGTISSSLIVAKANPTITNFTDLSNNYGDASFTLTAPTSNGAGAFVYTSSNNNVATITGNTVTIVGAGTATITATQASSSNYTAGSISALLTVNKVDPIITNFNVINKIYGNASFTITEPNSNSNGAFNYISSDNSVASVSGSVLTITGAGTATITATQSGNNNFNSNNNSISTSINVAKATPVLSGFSTINKIIGEADFTLIDPTSNSSGSFTYTSSDPNIAIINGNVVSIISVGTISITATQASDNNFNASSITTVLNITKPLATLNGFNNLNKNYGDADFSLTDPNSNSSGSFNYTSSNNNIATINGSTVSIIGAGTVTITATQASDANFETSSISCTLTVAKINPILSAFNPINKTYGDANFSIIGPNTNSNGLLTYTSSNTNVATISGTIVTIIGAGTATITSTQASTSNYNAGTIASTIYVSKATPTFGIFNNYNKAVGDANFTITAPSSNSNGAITYSISDNTIATLVGNTVTIIGAGTTTLTATQTSTNNYNSGTINATISVGQTNPIITNFPTINKTYGAASFALSAPTSNSNGAFTYTSSNNNVATITGNIVTIVGAGTTSITATQANSTNYTGGAIVTNLIVAKANPTITNFVTFNKTYGDASFTVSAPTSNSTGNFTYSSSNTSVANITGSTISITGTGTAIITATQASDANYNTGTITTSIIVSKANPIFGSFNSYNKAVGDANFALTGPSSNANGAITYTSSNPSIASIAGNIVTINGAGTATITATQASSSNFNSGSTSTIINVSQTNPTISNFQNISKTFGANTFTLTAPSSNSNGAFTYSSSNTNIVTISGNLVTIVGAGTASITATQATTSNYNSGIIVANISVAKATPTIGVLNVINKNVNDADFIINSPTSNSNAPFTFNSSNSNVATINGNVIHLVGVGSSTILATQSSNNNFNSGSTTTTLSVSAAQILNRIVNDSVSTHIDTLINGNIALNDSAPSDLYGNVVPDNANLSGAILNMQTTGNYNFTATQAGIYKYTISACSNGQQACPTSLLYINVNYLPQASINLKYNTLLASDSIKLIANCTYGVAPYNIIIKNNKDNNRISIGNINNTAIIPIAPRSDSAVYAIESITDANNVSRFNKFTKDTAKLYIVKPEILLSLKASTPELLADSTFKLNLLLSVENKGVIDVNGVQVVADLTKVFPTGMEYILDSVTTRDSILVLNPNYKGINPNAPAGIGQPFSYSTIQSNSIVLSEADLFNFGVNLQKLQHGNVNFSFRIRPHAVTAPPVFQFVGTGKGQLKQDDGSVSLTPTITNASTDGLNPSPTNKPVPTYTPLFPVDFIGTALESSLPTVVNGGYIFHYNTTIKNYSNENLLSINSSLDLQNIFQNPDSAYIVGNPILSNGANINPNFDGYNDKKLIESNGILAVGDTINASFDLFVRTNQLQHNWKINLTTTATSSLYNNSISDLSTNGQNPDPNNDKIPNENTYTISSVGFVAPANPTIKNLIYSLGNTTNPNDVNAMIVSTPTGSIPTWCDVNGNNCNTVAPTLPTITGVYTWCIKSYDTISGIYSTNCKYDTVTMLPNVITKKMTFVNTVTTNPSNIGSSIVSISAGSKPKWCDLNGNNCSFIAPSIPSTIGTYVWTVSAFDTITNLLSASSVKDTLVILDPNKVVDLNKRIEKVTVNADGTYTVQFNFIINNNSGQILNTLSINDDLTKVFGNSIDFKVISIDNSGYLNKNPKYDGVNYINLVGNNIILTDKKQDSISIKILVQGLHVDGDYTNTASAIVNTDYGIFKVVSNDPIANPINTSNRIATKFNIPKINVIVAGGFSPNNDGIDDTWIVERPFGTKISVKVFNRWGNEIYKNFDYQNDWRGKGISNFLGQDVQDGTYFYIVEATDINGVITKFNGPLTIVR